MTSGREAVILYSEPTEMMLVGREYRRSDFADEAVDRRRSPLLENSWRRGEMDMSPDMSP